MAKRRKGYLTASLGSSVQKLVGRQARPTDVLRVGAEPYDDVHVARSIRRLSKTMRAVAMQRDLVNSARWSYLIEATLDEMEREAEHLNKLFELRVAMLQVQSSCRNMVSTVRQVEQEVAGDLSVALLKYAVAWRKVFGPQVRNRLEAVLELAAMGAVLRNHSVAASDLVYVGTSAGVEAFDWNPRGNFMVPSPSYLGSGYHLGGEPRVAANRKQHRAAEAFLVPEPLTRSVLDPVEVGLSGHGQVQTPTAPEINLHHPHVSTPHPLHTQPRTRLAGIFAPGAELPTPVPRPLLRRMTAHLDAELRAPAEPAAPKPAPLPSAAEQVAQVVNVAISDMDRLAMPKRPTPIPHAPKAPSPSFHVPHRPAAVPPHRQEHRARSPRLPQRGI